MKPLAPEEREELGELEAAATPTPWDPVISTYSVRYLGPSSDRHAHGSVTLAHEFVRPLIGRYWSTQVWNDEECRSGNEAVELLLAAASLAMDGGETP